MKKLFALLIIGLVMFSGCDWFNQPASQNTNTATDNEKTIEEETTPVQQEDVIDQPTVDEASGVEEAGVEEAAADSSGDSPEVVLAKCMTAAGAKLYTASWCGHCKAQKEAFGDGLEYLDNHECAEGDGWSDVCTDAGVKAVPTWIFADGTVKTGNTPLATLAELTGCTYDN